MSHMIAALPGLENENRGENFSKKKKITIYTVKYLSKIPLKTFTWVEFR